MDIPHQFLQIRIFLAYDGFVSILEELTMTLVPSIAANSVSGKQPSHERGYPRGPASKEKMGMIRHEGPSVTHSLCFRQENRQPLNKVLSVFIVFKYPSALYSSDNNMMQEAGRIKSGHSRHSPNLHPKHSNVKLLDYLRTSPFVQ